MDKLYSLIILMLVISGCATKSSVKSYDVDCNTCTFKMKFDVKNDELSKEF